MQVSKHTQTHELLAGLLVEIELINTKDIENLHNQKE
jgi:hypothetical protein